MLRSVLLAVLVIFLARAFWRVIGGVVEGITGQTRPGGVVQQGVQMVCDPVCGTFVVPNPALSLSDGWTQVFFCSTRCRDQYRSGPSAGSGRPAPVEGRTA